MKKSKTAKSNKTPDENDFAALDRWARGLTLTDGRALTAAEKKVERQARGVGRPTKSESIKAKRVMISMTPDLIEAAGKYARKTGQTLSGLIAQSVREKIKRKAS